MLVWPHYETCNSDMMCDEAVNLLESWYKSVEANIQQVWSEHMTPHALIYYVVVIYKKGNKTNLDCVRLFPLSGNQIINYEISVDRSVLLV